jgi:peptidyl-prolyl cis-trans isomerase SurA
MLRNVGRWVIALGVGCSTVQACEGSPSAGQGELAAEQPAAKPSASEPSAPQPAAPAAGPGQPAGTRADPNEACARILVVAWKGAAHAAPEIQRDKAEAKARAQQLLAQARADAAGFGKLAAQHSDAPSSAARQGLIGTFERDAWPALHTALRDGVFALEVQQVSDVIEAPYGYVVAQRCPVEKAAARHILIRYKGAKRAESKIRRTKQAAEALAKQLHAKLANGEADFAELARAHSEDGSAERGGDLGSRGRGVYVAAFEDTLFALETGAISQVVETDMGFHIIQRLPD